MCVTIYALVDPRDNAIRYVGKTRQKLSSRLSGHLACAKYRRNHRERWIFSLLDNGLKPCIVALDSVEDSEADQSEIWWIAKMRDAGCDLTNATAGGDGGRLSQESEDKRLANSQWYRRSETPHAKSIRSAAASKRWQSLSEQDRKRIIQTASSASASRDDRTMSLSDSERRRRSEHGKQQMARLHGSRSPEERQNFARIAGLKNPGYVWTPEHRRAASDRRKSWWASLTEKERAEFNAKRLRKWKEVEPCA